MVYPGVLFGSPLLRKVSKNIEKDFANLDKLIEDMFETMEASDGVGLAAPQIGKSIRLFVIDANPMAEDDPFARPSLSWLRPSQRYGSDISQSGRTAAPRCNDGSKPDGRFRGR